MHVGVKRGPVVADSGDRVAGPHRVALGYEHLPDVNVRDVHIRQLAVHHPSEQDGARAALAAHAGDRGFGIDLDADHDSVEGGKQRLVAVAVTVRIGCRVMPSCAPLGAGKFNLEEFSVKER